jgi:hypothetical protein
LDSESSFSAEQDLKSFLDELRQYENRRIQDGSTVVERLERSLARLQELTLFVELTPPVYGQSDGWSPREILARTVLMTQVLGWGMWATGSGEQDEVSLSSFLSVHDVSGRQFAEMAPEELLDMARTELTNSMEYLCMADREEMARVGRVGPFELTAAEIGELLLCAHLEMRVEQLERSLQLQRREPSIAPRRYAH